MKLNSTLRYLILGGIFLIPFIPFIVPSTMFFPFITGKNFTFRILVEILFGLYAVLAIRESFYRPRFSWLLGVFGLFLVVLGVADAFGENPFKSFWSNYERMEGYITSLHLFAYFLVASATLNAEKLWERFFQTTLGASVIMSGVAILQLAGKMAIHQGSTRVDATLGNATYLAIYLVIHIFLALFLLLRNRESLWLRVMYGAIALTELYILYRTETRGAMLGFIGGAFLMTLIIALFERENKNLRKIAIGISVVIVAFVGLFVAFRDLPAIQSHPILGRFADISPSDSSATGRMLIWRMAYEGFKERPILGWGQENFNYVFNKHYNPAAYGQEQWFDRTHNVILDRLIEGGLLGLLSYLSLYLLSIFYLWRKGEFSFQERAVFTGLFSAYFVNNIFVFDNLISLILFVTFLAYLHSHATRATNSMFRAGAPNWLQTASIPAIGLLIAGILYFANWNPLMANYALIQALQASGQKPEEGLALIKKSLAYDGFGNQEIREQLMQFAINIRGAQVSDPVKQSAFELATSEMNKMIAQAPNDTRHYLFFGTVLDSYGATADAEKSLLRALELSPKKQSILFQLGSHYLNAGDTIKATSYFKQAYDLEPNYREAQIIYAMGLIYTGKIIEADAILGLETIVDDRLLRVYLDTQHYDRAIAIGKEKVAKNPSDITTALGLAGIYYQAGQKSNSIATIRAIIATNPGYREEGEKIIQQIQDGTVQ